MKGKAYKKTITQADIKIAIYSCLIIMKKTAFRIKTYKRYAKNQDIYAMSFNPKFMGGKIVEVSLKTQLLKEMHLYASLKYLFRL